MTSYSLFEKKYIEQNILLRDLIYDYLGNDSCAASDRFHIVTNYLKNENATNYNNNLIVSNWINNICAMYNLFKRPEYKNMPGIPEKYDNVLIYFPGGSNDDLLLIANIIDKNFESLKKKCNIINKNK